jgi:hypothetical protein
MSRFSTAPFLIIILAALVFVSTPTQAGQLANNPCNPCSVKDKNPCNPCSVKKKSAAAPYKAKKAKGFATFNQASAQGKKLWNDSTLGTTGFTCLSGGCHGDFENLSFEKNQLYPHYVEMTEKVVTLTQMINYCLVNPMAGRPLTADSDEMTAMAAFYRSYRMQFRIKNK